MTFDLFGNNTQQDPYNGIVDVNLKDLKAMADIANKLFNEALARPISAPNNYLQNQQSLRPYQNGVPMIPVAPAPMPLLDQYSYTASTPVITPEQNTQATIYNVHNVNTVADVIDAIEKIKGVSISWGKSTNLDILYTISPSVYLIRRNSGYGIHFNIDANNKLVKDTKKIPALEALSALVTYFNTLFEMCNTPVTAVELEDSNVNVNVGPLKLGVGSLALLKYVMGRSYYNVGTQVNVDGYLFTICQGYIAVQKTGYVPVSIDTAQFQSVVNSLLALNVFDLNDDIFRLYQDDPKELTTRLIIELNKATNKFEVITYEDIATLDSVMGIQIKNSLLGKQIKLSENIE